MGLVTVLSKVIPALLACHFLAECWPCDWRSWFAFNGLLEWHPLRTWLVFPHAATISRCRVTSCVMLRQPYIPLTDALTSFCWPSWDVGVGSSGQQDRWVFLKCEKVKEEIFSWNAIQLQLDQTGQKMCAIFSCVMSLVMLLHFIQWCIGDVASIWGWWIYSVYVQYISVIYASLRMRLYVFWVFPVSLVWVQCLCCAVSVWWNKNTCYC